MFKLESIVEKIGTSETFRGNQTSTYKAGGGSRKKEKKRKRKRRAMGSMFQDVHVYIYICR